MNLYSKKQRWKIALLGLAVFIIGFSLWYSNRIVEKIRNEERQKVRLWSEAIQNKAKLVNYTNKLFTALREGEREKVKLWAKATRKLASAEDLDDFTFVLDVVKNNTTVPVILTDEEGKINSYRNLDSAAQKDPSYLKKQIEIMAATYDPIEVAIIDDQKNYLYYKDSKIFSELQRAMDDLIASFISETIKNSASVPVIYTNQAQNEIIEYGNIDSNIVLNTEQMKAKINEMRAQNEPIEVDLGNGNVHYIFYEDSLVILQLRFYPFVQLVIIGFFLLTAYILFSTFRKAEQNQVWVGMAKETAHQLGTPVSSLIAWIELLKNEHPSSKSVVELEKDVKRLEVITDRFSKIGSRPELTPTNIMEVMESAVAYLQTRVSQKVKFTVEKTDAEATVCPINRPLFEWVIENLLKNAVDAMEGEGQLQVHFFPFEKVLHIDISDTGKGIPTSRQRTVFEPGFTTKKRGWGLGLSLTKRIIENYHAGKVYVKSSELGKGTTFRISLNR